MPLAKCINCGHTVSTDAKHCASCDMTIRRVSQCRICMGQGQISPAEGVRKICPNCFGTGHVALPNDRRSWWWPFG